MTEQTPLQQAQEIFRRATQLCQDLAALEETRQPEKILEAAPWEQPMPDLPQLRAAVTAAQEHTVALAGADDTQRIDLQDATMAEIKAWQQYAEGLEQFMAAAGRAVRGVHGTGRVPVELNTLTYAATALEGSADNGDRYAAQQIREAISRHPSPEAYMATQRAAVGHREQAEARETPWPTKSWYEAHVEAGSHKPVQHRDGKPAWCPVCGLTADGNVPMSRFGAQPMQSEALTQEQYFTGDDDTQPPKPQETKDVVAIAQDILRGYGHDAVADALAAAPKPSEDWIERVNRALWRYDNEYLTVRGVADALSGQQWSTADRSKLAQQLRTLIGNTAWHGGAIRNAGDVAEAILQKLEGLYTHG
jgi:hypothetical protein